MEREVGGGIGMGNTCKPMAVSFQCMTKFTTNKKKILFLLLISSPCAVSGDSLHKEELSASSSDYRKDDFVNQIGRGLP